MLAFLNVYVDPQSDASQRGEPPNGAVFVFQFLSGDVVLLEKVLPESEFVKALEFGKGTLTVSVSALTDFKNELESLDEPALPQLEVPRSALHPGVGRINTFLLKRSLGEAIDEALSEIAGVTLR